MMQILEDGHLDSLQCSRCHKYLSVFPVKNHVSRDVTCGRCSSFDDEEGVQSTLYELIAERHLFKCINRYEGCRKLLRVEETEAHEKVCKGKLYQCPKCKDGTDLSVLELIWHYKLRHPTSYLKKNCFEGKVPVNNIMLYVQNEVVFFIFFKYDSSSNILYFGAATLTEVNVSQVFMIKQGSLCELTKKKSCKLVNSFEEGDFHVTLNSVESIELIFNLEVSRNAGLYEVSMCCMNKGENSIMNKLKNCQFTAQFKSGLNNYSGYTWSDNGTALVNETGHEIDLACSNCKLIIGLPVFRCIKSQHQLCYSCRTCCGICECFVVKAAPNDVLLEISPHLSLSCKWKCSKFFNASDIRAHEGVCELRSRKCPKCSTEVDLKLMKNHLLGKYKRYFLEEYDVEKVMNLIYNNKEGCVYFLLNDKWCYLGWKPLDNEQYQMWFNVWVKVPNQNLCVIPSHFNFKPNVATNINFKDIPLCKPYLKFTHN